MRTSVLLCVLLATAVPAYSADITPLQDRTGIETGNEGKQWEFAGSLYLWAAGLSATTGIGDLPAADIDASFTDTLENLDFAFMGLGEARYDRFGLFGDVVYSKISAEANAIGPFSGQWSADATTELLIGTAGVQYRVFETGNSSIDLMAAARLYHLSLDAGVTLCSPLCVSSQLPGFAGLGARREYDETWVDPLIGAKSRIQGDSPWYLTGWGFIGGFGAGSDFSWDVFGGIGYDINDRWSVFGGYRALGFDYESDNFAIDAVMQGPIASAVLRF